VGVVEGDVFMKRISGSKHFLRKPPAIAFDISSLQHAEEAGATIVQVTDVDNGEMYRCTMHRIWQKGFEIDRGHGAQQAVTMENWTTGDNPLTVQQELF
jgi:hypothetical protein